MRRRAAVLVSLLLLAAAGCKESARKPGGTAVPLPPSAATEARPQPFPAAGVQAAFVTHSVALYRAGQPDDPEPLLRGACAQAMAGLERVDALAEQPAHPQIMVVRPPLADLPAPDVHLIEVNGVDVGAPLAAAVQQSEGAVMVTMRAPIGDARRAVRQVDTLIACLAAPREGLLVDFDTVQMFSAAAWRERRVEAWDGDVPHLDQQVVVHVYRDGEYGRAVSLGMGKFGLPDVVIEGFLESNGGRMVSIIALVAQLLVVDGQLPADGQLEITLDRPELKGVIDRMKIVTLPGAPRRLRLDATVATPAEGDQDNRQLRIRFDSVAGAGERERQAEAFRLLFGADEEKVVGADTADAEVNAARERAVKRLPELRAMFARGLAPGAHMLVKAPFATPDGDHEWMWIEIVSWKGERIEGVLQNDPVKAKDVKLGAEVRVQQGDVFDYLYVHADGTQEGNETGKILLRQDEQQRGGGGGR